MSHKVRDLDYVNPRQKLPGVSLPPEVRAQLGLGPREDRTSAKSKNNHSASQPVLLVTTPASPASLDGIKERLAKGGKSDEVYVGRSNLALGELAGSGKAGAGSDWVNPCGHAFVRRVTSQKRLETLRARATESRQDLDVAVAKKRETTTTISSW